MISPAQRHCQPGELETTLLERELARVADSQLVMALSCRQHGYAVAHEQQAKPVRLVCDGKRMGWEGNIEGVVCAGARAAPTL